MSKMGNILGKHSHPNYLLIIILLSEETFSSGKAMMFHSKAAKGHLVCNL